VSPEDETLTAIRMSANILDLDIPPDQMDDPQVAIWRDKYDVGGGIGGDALRRARVHD